MCDVFSLSVLKYCVVLQSHGSVTVLIRACLSVQGYSHSNTVSPTYTPKSPATFPHHNRHTRTRRKKAQHCKSHIAAMSTTAKYQGVQLNIMPVWNLDHHNSLPQPLYEDTVRHTYKLHLEKSSTSDASPTSLQHRWQSCKHIKETVNVMRPWDTKWSSWKWDIRLYHAALNELLWVFEFI